jgi:preprotein translocase subunit SecE
VQNKYSEMENLKLYLKDTYNEFVYKTSWPALSELQKSTVLVAVGSIIFSLIIFAMDKGLSFILENVYELLS